MPRFEIDAATFAAFPAMEVHAFRCRNAGSIVSTLDGEALLAQALAVSAVAGGRQVGDVPSVARWRDAYRSMGTKPSRFQSSIEALLRRAGKGSGLHFAVPLVGFYNAHSLLATAPVGAYDVAKLVSDPILLRPCRPTTDHFQPLGGNPEQFPLVPGLIVYASGSTVLCWGFNHRDSNITALEPRSEDVAFFSEASFNDQTTAAACVIGAMRQQFLNSGGFCTEHLIANQNSPSFEF
jgi:DNA/RNA-binding domain of Phe-tRNA-synthetase-like protein